MAVGLSIAGAALGVLVLAALTASSLAECDFTPTCRPGETYRVAIPCDGKCSAYIQCQDGAATEKMCGKFFWHQNEFDAATLDCVRNADCDWWKKIEPSTTSTTTTTTEAATTAASSAAPETTAAPSSSEAPTTPAPVTAQPTTAAPTTSPRTTSTPSPAESKATSPLAAMSSVVLAAVLAVFL